MNSEDVAIEHDSEPEIVIPESERIPNTPSVEEYVKHQITHYPFKSWCPICVKNAAQNNPHKKVQHVRQTEVFGLDYMYMTSKPTKEEVAHPILVIKARISGGVWALPVTRKGPYLNNVVQRVNNIITCRLSKVSFKVRPRTSYDSLTERS